MIVAIKNREDEKAMAKITVGVGAVVFKDETILLIKRGKEPFLGQWSIPGGGLEYGERLEDGMRREVLEETNVTIKDVRRLGVFEALPIEGQGSGHVILIDYFAQWASGEAKAGDDAAEAVFVPIEDAIERVIWDETRKAIQIALKLREEALKAP